MKKHLFGLSLAALVIAGAAAQALANDPRDTRRTLFVPVGQQQITLEAPQSMCFLDQTAPSEGLFLQQMADAIAAGGSESLLAVFAPCNAVANIGSTGSIEILKNMGTVTWENPLIGEKTPMSRADYLAMREEDYKDYTLDKMGALLDAFGTTDPDKYQIEGDIRRSDNGIALAFRSDITIDYEKFKTVGVTATTTLRDHPIEVTLRATGKDEPSADALHGIVDGFLAQQVALNN